MTELSRWARVRIVACGLGLGVLLFAIASRAYDLQIRDAARLRGLAEEQYLREVELPPRRGRILDRNGAELASTADVDSIHCNPSQLPDVPGAARQLGKALGLDAKELERRLFARRYFAWIKRRVTPDEAAAVRALRLPGVGFSREPRRFYPNRTLGATVMGHAGVDGQGLEGVELALDGRLAGEPTSVLGVRDALGRELFVDGAVDASAGAGADVVLTIDRYLTFVAERELARGVEKARAKAGVAIVLDPRNGDILAMASVPTYNPNEPGTAAAAGARNRALTDVFEPGSTMKIFTLAAALETGAVRPEDRFDCMMGKMTVGKHTIHDTHPEAVLTAAEIFKHSSNIGMTKIARKLGKERLAEALGAFGFGRQTGLGLPGERPGFVRPPDRWGDIGFANVSFGQGLTVTPLQLAAGVAVIASGGVHRPPRIVARTVGADGRTEEAPAPRTSRVVSEATAKTMASIMRSVTDEGGTARLAAIEGYPVAGKTGTAQKVSGGRYDADKWMASFVGFAPAHDPRVAIVVVVDEPQGMHLGGAVAAPIFKEIGEQALRYLHVPAAAPSIASRAKAGKDAETAPPDERPGSDVAEGQEDVDVALGEDEPAPGEEAVLVPDFRHRTMVQSIALARRGGVDLAMDGSGVAVKQRPEPGLAARGVTVRVTFAPRE